MNKIEKIDKAIYLLCRKIVSINEAILGFGGQNFPDLKKKWSVEKDFLKVQVKILERRRLSEYQKYVRSECRRIRNNDWIYKTLCNGTNK